MTAEVSVVVPTRNAEATLSRCLASIRVQHDVDVELIVVDNASTDTTVAIAERYADRVVIYGPERSAQRNRGWRLATARIVIFLDADMVVEPGVAAEAVALLAADQGLGALVIPEESFGVGFLASCRAVEKRLYLEDPSVEAARVYTRRALEEVGGFDERLTAFEDWDLADRISAAGFGCGRTDAHVWHDEGRIRLRAAFAKKRYYGRWLRQYRRPDGPPPRPIGRPALLYAWPALAAHPVTAAGLIALKTVEATGFVVGAMGARRADRL